jgi:hypothetical protein
MPLADFGPSEAWMLMRAYRVYSWRIHGVSESSRRFFLPAHNEKLQIS